MSLRPYKFIVKAVPQILNDDGEVIGEETRVSPVELIGAKQVTAWIEKFSAEIPQLEAQIAAVDTPVIESKPNRAERRAKPPTRKRKP